MKEKWLKYETLHLAKPNITTILTEKQTEVSDPSCI